LIMAGSKNILSKIKFYLKSNYFLFKAIRLLLGFIGYFKQKVDIELDHFWAERIALVTQAPDNAYIERVAGAGTIRQDTQLMHNGIKINVGSYYGDGNTVLLYKNKGVHEPQEEKAFGEVLKFIPADGVMLELGAFWGFYSMSFLNEIKGGRSFLIEPDQHALISGKNNFRLNKLTGFFYNYFVSDAVEEGAVPTITVTDFLKKNHIDHLNILHSDIQGFELKMLKGANDYLITGKIDYIFISTHNNDIHRECKDFLINRNYIILCDADLDETYSWDGLIVAKHQSVVGPRRLNISKR
jgi:hypothetical protein